MKYLAFDIEAANGYKLYSICSIGIVIADENFNVIHSENVWINPKTKYNLNGTRQNVGIDLHLDKKLLDSSPDFPLVYGKICKLLCDKDTVVIGHAVDSDVRMLNAACEHYRLPSIDFKFVCTQLLYRLFRNEKEVKALNKIANELNLYYREHNSEDDAWMSLMTLKYLCNETRLTLDELLAKYHVRIGSNVDFELTRPVSLDGQVSKKHVTVKAVYELVEFANQLKGKSNEFSGKTFAVARSIEVGKPELAKKLIEKIVCGGGKYTPKLSNANCYVWSIDSTQQDVMRERRVCEMQSENKMKIYFVDQLIGREENMSKVEEFLISKGQSTSNINVEQMVETFLAEMKLGLNGKGCLPMIPTYLGEIKHVRNNSKRILIDAGGTNFRSAIGYFDDNAKVCLENIEKTIMPATDRELSKDEFYGQIAENVKRLLPQSNDVGFCFSYNVSMGSDVDGICNVFSKEVKAPEVVGTKVGKCTVEAIKQIDGKDRSIVILNDTVATLLGGQARHLDKKFSGFIGYIFGTGVNSCYLEKVENIKKVSDFAQDKMIVNTELGNFDKFKQGEYDVIVANNTNDPTSQLYEKMVSGRYLGDVIYLCMDGFERSGGFSKHCEIEKFNLIDVSEFLNGVHGKIYNLFTCDEDRTLAKEICENLIDRAGKMGAIVNGAIASVIGKPNGDPVAIVCEGTTFNRLVGYRACFERYLNQILAPKGVTFEILQGEELNLVGTLMATMAKE